MKQFDVLVVGAGFAGMYMLHRLRTLGFTARVFEAGSGVGGTWYWNRYPGARCDVESMEYSYQFSEALQQEWRWSERYAAQPEILRYANHVADRFDLRRDMQFDTRVAAARFDESSHRWIVRTQSGEEASAQSLVMATGCLSSTNLPSIEGLDSFAGETYHTGRWPHHPVDFTGKRVGMIGTGSSAVQSIPLIAAQAKSLVVFQRTATYSVPARNAPLDPHYEARIKADYAGFRARNSRMPNAFGSELPRNETPALSVPPEVRARAFEERWRHGGLFFLGAFGDLIFSEAANQAAAGFVRAKIRETVRDPQVARLLEPRQVIGCKRLCIDSGYYETFNRPNVQLVDVSHAPVERITPRGLRTGGRDYELDCIVFATGFDAMTGALMAIDIRGRNGLALRDKWRDGPRNYLGLGIAGFPNLFTVSGPGSPSVLTNMLVSIEQHVNWIADCIAYLRASGRSSIEARVAAEDAWVAHVNSVADRTVYPLCNSWYLGANVPGKPRVFMPLLGFPQYVVKCDEVAARGYEGFALA
ncbi:MAG TPA: NAD(P)/FAD-dependent oxidoreductase [Burkholderiales bacterium]|nr:NAD(P)/FAD-dependent oxidoreductase [Burkholderiales bacterium]